MNKNYFILLVSILIVQPLQKTETFKVKHTVTIQISNPRSNE